MTQQQILVFAVLACAMALFLWGRWRHDVVALAALIACVLAGLVSPADAFSGFGHPAVITVACVLVLSRGLQTTGAVDALAQRLLPDDTGTTLGIASLTGLGALLSAFMNNVGAMALLMPVAVQLAGRHELPPGKVLMPLAFGTILGGMTTLIGTPPNMIVSGFRSGAGPGAFGMFDFTPVGLAVALLGVLFAALLGWRLVPTRPGSGASSFDTGTYLTEVRVVEDGKAVGKQLRELEQDLERTDAQIVGMVRNDFRVFAPNPGRRLRAGDVLVLEAEPEALAQALTGLGLSLDEPGDKEGEARQEDEDSDLEAGETQLQELVVMPYSGLVGRTAADIQMRARYGINLLAVSRQGHQSIRRLRFTAIRTGDLLLMQGAPEALAGFSSELGCVPLAARSIHIPDRNKALYASLSMGLAILVAALGWLPASVAFAAAVLAFVLFKVLSPGRVYESLDGSVIVLLGALFPVAAAMEQTGAADLLAQGLLQNLAQGQPVLALALILIVTMTLSDFMNNAATAAVMCPIALSSAGQLGVNPDSFLMAVAIGASCAFLTPIGHQNNTLILGPGGFRFGDYWRLGLPMELIVVGVSLPMLLLVWPL
ncbi:SLC13 family permease [Marinobacterium nitratireducens]|uniref:SLC13 family permease n=1 Tax=Marinobacterium nitratireducens TaxID=518897 RepID=A0A917ZPG5_9GAMM|nr:SLC13 family permease [Marinobacterium nitratireducens]GGO88807.1 SLC13 family permease [Marinobacterium nitratireducens]